MNRANRPRFSRISGSSYASKLMGRAGDGSTLTLDFTTGVLDPRLTFTRGSNATFINSSGLVQWADSNIFYNSTWTDANNTPTAWSAGSGTASRSGETRTFTTTASQVYITQTRNTSSGIRYTASVEVTAVTGTQRIDDVIVALGGSSYQYYFDGSAAAGSTTLTAGVVGVAFTAGAATTTVRVGSGVQGTNTTGSVTLRFPQFEPGSVASRIYRPNDSTTASYEAPRFDNDPTTPFAPKGLLIEGSAVNLLLNSGDFTGYNFINTAQGTTATAPDNGTAYTLRETSASITTFGMTSGNRTVTASTAYTLSVFIKAATNARRYIVLRANDGGSNANAASLVWDTQTNTVSGAATAYGTFSAALSNSTQYGSSWYRVELRFTTGAGITTVNCKFELSDGTRTADGQASPYLGSTNLGVLLWGAQLETGSGASSYIPTGASTGNRSRDEVVLSNLSAISFNQSAGTIYSQLEIVEKLRGSFVPYGSFDTSGGGRCWWWLRHNHDTSSGQRILGNAFNSAGSTAITSSNYTHSSGVFKFATSLDPTASRMVYAIAGGSAQATTASAFTLATAAQMSLNKNNDVATTDLGSMWVRTIKYWPTALPDAQLTTLTT